jgi:signal transduction histidine kinase
MKIKYRLTLLFALVIAAGAAATTLLVRRSAESVFRSLVFSGDAEKAAAYASFLADYRAEKGCWQGVQEFLEGLPGLFSAMVDSSIHGSSVFRPGSAGTMRALMADRVVVADSSGLIVGDSAGLILGTVHPDRHLKHGIPIQNGSLKVGTVLVGSMVDSSLTGAEENFLDSILAAIAWSAAASAAIALPLGVAFAARITRPLQGLALAVGRVASGAQSETLPVKGDDELAALSEAFNEMNAELRRLDAAKRQVIADSAHELRTPLTLIQGMVEGMIDGILPADKKTLSSVHEETLRLSRLVDTLRELEIIESGELELRVEPVDLSEILRKAARSFSAAAAEKSIRLFFEEPRDEGPPARGDRLRLGEVVYNLVANAIRHAPEGGVVRMRLRSDDSGLTGFDVDDSGPGLPPEERERVFERFYRVDKSRSAQSGGRGLGLAICSEIVKAHRGSIAAEESDLGGARFCVRIPRMAD